MALLKLDGVGKIFSYFRRLHVHTYCTNIDDKITYSMSKYLRIKDSEAKYLYMKYPAVRNLDEQKLKELIETVCLLGYSKKVLINEPVLFCHLPVTLSFRHRVLSECGFNEVTPKHLATYLPLVKQYTIQQLKNNALISAHINVENRLASYMTQWPTSLTTGIYSDVNELNLSTLRLKIIQKYLELVLELTNDEFMRGIQVYPTLKHRPLAAINETLTLLLSEIKMPTQKIKSNFYLVHADPQNLKEILYKFRVVGGIDVKEVIRMYPKIALKKYSTLNETKKILKEFEISEEAQRRCFNIYTLSPETVRERLTKAKDIPEFETFLKHPRFLKMIHFKNTAIKRLQNLYKNNKKCLSLNILSGSSAHYDIFEKSPGDRLGKGKDLIFCLMQCFENKYTSVQLRSVIKRHPYWINIPLVQVKYVHQKLTSDFSPKDIYENCPILLYPWDKIKNTLKLFNSKANINFLEHIDLTNLGNSQKLSLALYLLERDHYFSGNGVWSEEKLGSNVVANVAELKNSVLS